MLSLSCNTIIGERYLRLINKLLVYVRGDVVGDILKSFKSQFTGVSPFVTRKFPKDSQPFY